MYLSGKGKILILNGYMTFLSSRIKTESKYGEEILTLYLIITEFLPYMSWILWKIFL